MDWFGSQVSDERKLPTVKRLSQYVKSATGGAFADVRTLGTLVALKAAADIVSKAVTLVLMVVAARVLPTADFGILALALTTGWLLGVASDAGLPIYVTKRVARDVAAGHMPSLAAIGHVARARAMLAMLSSAVGLAVAAIMAPGAGFWAFWLIVIAQLLNATLDTLAHAYRGLGRTDVESAVLVAQRVATAVLVLVVLSFTRSLLLVALALVVPPAAALVVSRRIAARVLARGLSACSSVVSPDVPSLAADARQLEKRGLSPFSHVTIGVAALVSALYFRCDLYFVERWHGLETAGVYNATFRIVEALRLIPAAVLAVTFPRLCTVAHIRPLRAVATMLAILAVLVAVPLYFAAPSVLAVLYGDRFVDGAPALQTLALAVPLFFINYALTHQVIGWDGQRSYLMVTLAALAVNLVANGQLIRSGGMNGAAQATLLTEVVVAAGCVAVLARQVRLVGRADSAPNVTPDPDAVCGETR